MPYTKYYTSEHCLIRTNYHKTIQNVLESFESKDIYVGIYENMFEEKEIEKLSNFLGVTLKFDFASVQVNKTKNMPESDKAIENELRGYYKNGYDFCYEKFNI